MGLHKYKMWLLHLPQRLTTSANNNQLAITSANNIHWLSTKKSDNNICHKNNKKFGTNSATNDKHVNFWQNNHPKLQTITFYIHHQM